METLIPRIAQLEGGAGDEDRLQLGAEHPGLEAADERVPEDHDRAAAGAGRDPLRLAEQEAVDAVLPGFDRPQPDEAADQQLVQGVEVGRIDQVVDQVLFLHLPRDRREHLQVVAGGLAGQQHHDQVDAFVPEGAIVADAHAAAADGEHIAAGHPDADVRERDAVAEVGGHRALAREEAAEQRVGLQVGEFADAGGEQFLEGALEVEAAHIDDAAAGKDLLETHRTGPEAGPAAHFSHSSAPLRTS